MRSLLPVTLLLSATLFLAGGTPPSSSPLAPPTLQDVQTIDVAAKKYEFSGSPIHVKQGARVQLKITATDHAHGFRISEFPEGVDTKGKPGLIFSSQQDCQKIEEGKTATVEFVAQTPGTYHFRCCVHCGWHHRAMTGELIVEP